MPYVTTPPQVRHFQASPIALPAVGKQHPSDDGFRLVSTDLGSLKMRHCGKLRGQYTAAAKLDETGKLAVYPDFKLEKKEGRVEFGTLTGPLVGVHAHATSEHTLPLQDFDRNSYAEIHFVFKLEKKSHVDHEEPSTMLVVGVLIERTSEPTVPSGLGSVVMTQTEVTENVDLQDVVEHAANSPLYVYDGSLTSPPYTEAVHWCVAATALKETPAITPFLKHCSQPSRDVQPQGRRFILYSNPKTTDAGSALADKGNKKKTSKRRKSA